MTMIRRRLLAVLIVAVALAPVAVASVVYRSMTDVTSSTIVGLELAGSVADADLYLCPSDRPGCTTPDDAVAALRADSIAFVPGYGLTLLLCAVIALSVGHRRAAAVAVASAAVAATWRRTAC